MKSILVLGATSAIAVSFCRKLASSGASFFLLGRNQERLRVVAEDLLVRGALSVETRVVVPGDFSSLRAAMTEGLPSGGIPDLFLAAQGLLPLHEECEKDPFLLGEVFQVNAVEVMQATLLAAAEFERQGHGDCVIIGSVAGDRGRRGNYVYGAAKASLETFCDGLRQRLEPACRVLLVKPGPVDTPMTAHLAKGVLFTTPEKVARDIMAALGRDSGVLYTPFYWRWVMGLIRLLPARIVKRLRA